MGRTSGVLAALKPGRNSITPRVAFFPAKKKSDAHLPRAKFEATPISRSIEHENKHNPLSKPALGHQHYMFGDVGMIYIFFCFDCLQLSCSVQYY
jgi:hypothetical protein